ncbi:MAG: hypothetical protein J2P40_09865 [Candidatus Dormibacteraeota bacterium]|nr:hypothetical protein [Candidatus Dormibacteraeota bacterium]MBO0761570.1 hypothetical protein [Candidatus Dormibacteraeota bacterium]
MQRVGAADTGTGGAGQPGAEEAHERAARSAELGAAIEEVLAEVWRAESWWATEDRIDAAVKYLHPDR